MTAEIIDGIAVAAELTARIHGQVEQLAAAVRLKPTLAVVLVGENPSSQVYVSSKARKAKAIGIAAVDHRLPASTAESDLLALIRKLNADPAVHGILVQLPLPDHIATTTVLEAIDPAKDVDGFHPVNVGLLGIGDVERAFVPCTPLGCLLLLRDRFDDLTGMNALIIGRSTIVGRPMAQLLVRESCTVTIAHSKTADLEGRCRQADIVVAAVGRPDFVRGSWIKPGATVIDVGINRVTRADGANVLTGDVAFAEVAAVAGAVTPVPGGVGPMTIACLLANTVTSACRHAGLAPPRWAVPARKPASIQGAAAVA
ncbi:MAG: bifunctional methylenetetrahydrofolate dehydrogenase/methenyltetrahydrofolate cyclohydrolase FolD [Proteobacteria bacterium]|nr:bifunctional methylenetetrahydrofolate dehydrogenase/methenyltetrahydrofolate cyclohydrolase FolD [Pseudomonadota bacterium]